MQCGTDTCDALYLPFFEIWSNTVHCAACLCAFYAMSGTSIAYPAISYALPMQCPVLAPYQVLQVQSQRTVLPTGCLRDVLLEGRCEIKCDSRTVFTSAVVFVFDFAVRVAGSCRESRHASRVLRSKSRHVPIFLRLCYALSGTVLCAVQYCASRCLVLALRCFRYCATRCLFLYCCRYCATRCLVHWYAVSGTVLRGQHSTVSVQSGD
eukprot:3860850-Rhodomonas_salina.2